MENHTQRHQKWMLFAVIAAVIISVFAFKSILPMLIVFTALAIYSAVMEARKDAKERKGTNDPY